MAISSRFWDRIAERYARTPVPDEAIYQEKLRLTREYLRPDMNVLEFGCGTGTTAIAHAPFVRRIVGIDSSAKMIEIARARSAAASAKNVTFDQASIEEFADEEESFDCVLALSILQLLDDWERAVRKVHRMLKPGGILVSSTPCLGGKYAMFRMLRCQ